MARSNYGNSIESYVYFLIKVDTMAPGGPYDAKRVIWYQNLEELQFQRYFLSKHTLYLKALQPPHF